MPKNTRFAGYTVAPDIFVVHGDGEKLKQLEPKLSELGRCEAPTSVQGLRVLTLPKSKSQDPKESWSSLQGMLGDEVEILPVLINDDGFKQYPAGHIMVRFQESPSDAELQAWSKAHKLDVVTRNKYTPKQVSLKATSPSTQYLPEVVDQIQQEGEGQRVWLDTMSTFRRE